MKAFVLLTALLSTFLGFQSSLAQPPFQVVGSLGAKTFYTAENLNATYSKGTFVEYINFCQSNGFYTAVIGNQAEFQLVNNFFLQFPPWSFPYWSGAVDFNSEGTFHWLRNMQPVEPSSWLNTPNATDPYANCAFISGNTMTSVPCTSGPWWFLCQNQ